ncbi:MAG: hypothetical protein U0235_16355 [Polyangiaceae bacterium]
MRRERELPEGLLPAQSSTSRACTSDAQCSGATPKCLAGKCSAPCTSDTQCGAGNYCNQGACRRHAAEADLHRAGQVGVLGQPSVPTATGQRPTCGKDDDCRLIDARIGYCGVDHVCRTPAEAKPQCTAQTDCAGRARAASTTPASSARRRAL